MQEFQELAPDQETFARVWKRVMPDESVSPIVVHQPPKGQNRPARPRPTPQPGPEPIPEPVAGDEQLLRRLLESVEEGLAGAGEILRRQPGARPLLESLRGSAGQLRAAWFLLTGRRWQPGRMNQSGGGELSALLRRQYIWEIDFSHLARETGRAVQAEDVREIFPELEEQSARRRGMIRRMLARG